MYNNYTYTVDDIKTILRISRASAYQLVNDPLSQLLKSEEALEFQRRLLIIGLWVRNSTSNDNANLVIDNGSIGQVNYHRGTLTTCDYHLPSSSCSTERKEHAMGKSQNQNAKRGNPFLRGNTWTYRIYLLILKLERSGSQNGSVVSQQKKKRKLLLKLPKHS